MILVGVRPLKPLLNLALIHHLKRENRRQQSFLLLSLGVHLLRGSGAEVQVGSFNFSKQGGLWRGKVNHTRLRVTSCPLALEELWQATNSAELPQFGMQI